MQQSASRILTGVVTMVAENIAKPLIEGVFVPATQGSLSMFFSYCYILNHFYFKNDKTDIIL
jgi:hypothetical protein